MTNKSLLYVFVALLLGGCDVAMIGSEKSNSPNNGQDANVSTGKAIDF